MPSPDPRDLKRFRRQAASHRRRVARGPGLRRVPAHARPHEPAAPGADPLGHLARSVGPGTRRSTARRRSSRGTLRSRTPTPTSPPRCGVSSTVSGSSCARRCRRARTCRVWVREALPTLPEIMAASDRRTNGVERRCTDAVEAAELHPFVGRTLDGGGRRREPLGRSSSSSTSWRSSAGQRGSRRRVRP